MLSLIGNRGGNPTTSVDAWIRGFPESSSRGAEMLVEPRIFCRARLHAQPSYFIVGTSTDGWFYFLVTVNLNSIILNRGSNSPAYIHLPVTSPEFFSYCGLALIGDLYSPRATLRPGLHTRQWILVCDLTKYALGIF